MQTKEEVLVYSKLNIFALRIYKLMYETAETADEAGQITLNGLTLQRFLHVHSYKHAKIPSKKLYSSECKPLSIFMTSLLTAELSSQAQTGSVLKRIKKTPGATVLLPVPMRIHRFIYLSIYLHSH